MWRGLGSMNKGPNATIRSVRRQNNAGTTVSWTTVQREKNSHAYKLSSNVQTACSTDSLNNCPKHSILRFSSFALKIYLWLKMCQHNLPCSIVLPTACFPEGPSPHFTFCSFWRRRPRLEAVTSVDASFNQSGTRRMWYLNTMDSCICTVKTVQALFYDAVPYKHDCHFEIAL